MNRKQTKKSTVFSVMPILVAVILFATNPSESQFKEFLKNDFSSKGENAGGFSGAFMQVVAGPRAWVLGLTTEKKDFHFFSCYAVTGLDKTEVYVGVLNHFIKVRSR